MCVNAQIIQHLERLVHAVLQSRNLDSSDLGGLAKIMGILERLPNYDFIQPSLSLRTGIDYGKPHGTSYMEIAFTEEGLTMEEGGIERSDHGSERRSRVVYEIKPGKHEMTDLYFDAESWIQEFVSGVKDPKHSLSIRDEEE